MARRTHVRIPSVGRLLPPIGDEFVHVETNSAIALLVGTAAALAWANVDGPGYAHWWAGDFVLGASRHAFVNDGLLSIFFFLIGLEIRRELVSGELRDRRRAAVPCLAALGGMAAAGLVFLAFGPGRSGADGWAIPMSTDIPFALGVLALAGRRLPPGARLFLLTLALFDDLASIVLIAVFFSGGVSATVVAAAVALVVPTRLVGGRRVLERMEHWLLPVSSFVVIPLFAVANAGINVVDLDGSTLQRPMTIAVVVGRIVGKPLGIVLVTALCLWIVRESLPAGVGLRHIVAIGAVSGIGFTVALFVADRALGGSALVEARLGVLVAALASATVGAVLLWLTTRDRAEEAG